MYGTREFRFSYTDKDSQEQFLWARNIWLATKIVAERGGTNCKRAPIGKKKIVTAHCQICGREIGATTGVIAHHGYTRPGSGWQTASCFGARWRPYETHSDALPVAIDNLTRYIEMRTEVRDGYITNPPASITFEIDGKWNFDTRKYDKVKVTVDKPEGFDTRAPLGGNRSAEWNERDTYPRRFHAIVNQIDNDIISSKQYLDYLKKRLADWRAP